MAVPFYMLRVRNPTATTSTLRTEVVIRSHHTRQGIDFQAVLTAGRKIRARSGVGSYAIGNKQ